MQNMLGPVQPLHTEPPAVLFTFLKKPPPQPSSTAVFFTSISASLLWPGARHTSLAGPWLSVACCYRHRLRWGSALSAGLRDLYLGVETKDMHTDNMTTMDEYIDQLLAKMQQARLEALDNSVKRAWQRFR